MDKLKEIEEKFESTCDKWTKAQWKFLALTLLNKNPALPAKRGRPKKNEDHQQNSLSRAANYQALAHEVIQRRVERGDTGIKKIVKEIMIESYKQNKQEGWDKREGYIKTKLNTTYDAVRKIISAWKKAGK